VLNSFLDALVPVCFTAGILVGIILCSIGGAMMCVWLLGGFWRVLFGERPLMQHEFCICAAVVTYEGKIFRGHRHDDAITTAGKAGYHPSSLQATQGFMTSRGRFVNRIEAAELQRAAGIKSIHTERFTDLLFSEDLY
jgi:hypothetical protein